MPGNVVWQRSHEAPVRIANIGIACAGSGRSELATPITAAIPAIRPASTPAARAPRFPTESNISLPSSIHARIAVRVRHMTVACSASDARRRWCRLRSDRRRGTVDEAKRERTEADDGVVSVMSRMGDNRCALRAQVPHGRQSPAYRSFGPDDGSCEREEHGDDEERAEGLKRSRYENRRAKRCAEAK